jgi:hypothetical protein
VSADDDGDSKGYFEHAEHLQAGVRDLESGVVDVGAVAEEDVDVGGGLEVPQKGRCVMNGAPEGVDVLVERAVLGRSGSKNQASRLAAGDRGPARSPLRRVLVGETPKARSIALKSRSSPKMRSEALWAK